LVELGAVRLQQPLTLANQHVALQLNLSIALTC
jgi:hypothetical protein